MSSNPQQCGIPVEIYCCTLSESVVYRNGSGFSDYLSVPYDSDDYVIQARIYITFLSLSESR